MSRKRRLEQERAIQAHKAHLNLLRGMAAGIEKILPDNLHFVIITFAARHHSPAGYVSNGERHILARVLKHQSANLATGPRP